MTPPASPRTTRYWTRQVTAEYGSAGHTAELLHWCIVLGLTPDTLALAHRIVADELAHARGCRAVVRAAGSADPIPMDPSRSVLVAGVGEPVHCRALLVAANTFCLGEGVAVPLFRAMRERATVPEVVAVLDRIGVDERVHAAFGWVLLDELLDRVDASDRDWLAARIPDLCISRVQHYSGPSQPVTDAEAAWGLLDPEEAGAITARAVTESLEPRFRSRGLVA